MTNRGHRGSNVGFEGKDRSKGDQLINCRERRMKMRTKTESEGG